MKKEKAAFIDGEGVIHEINLKSPRFKVIQHNGWREVEILEHDGEGMVLESFQLHKNKEELLKFIESGKSNEK